MKINLHTHRASNDRTTLDIVNQYPGDFDGALPFYSIGIHPWYIVEESLESHLAVIDRQLQSDRCLALGECGLDKRIAMPMDIQIAVFERQLALAEQHQKPVIIHCVSAFQELLAVRKRLNISVPFVIHGFSKNLPIMRQLLQAGCYLSFGKYLLRNDKLATVFMEVPHDRFFLETDTMEETLEEVYQKAAAIKGLEVKEIEQYIENTALLVFGFSEKLRNALA
ncbi:TatD family hydrolase [Flavobacterium sp. JP2137]|uniref:TatD family hydrolase n=1 Tax=Flavobacterium sp. JP2137 TaxID=3414510 RepID=UPI003D2FECB2